MRGFESFTTLKSNIRDSKQIYDITYHLYQSEQERLENELAKNGNKDETVRTSIGSIEHSTTALAQRLKILYPFKLRQLILISSVTALEVYLTDVILEIFKRDITPFKKEEPITLPKNYLLNLSSVDKLQNDLILKDFRNLTSGGLIQIEKYYNKMFNINIKNLGIDFKLIEEIHIRRHLFVHRNGLVDAEYASKYPEYGYKATQQIRIEHQYLIDSLSHISEFARLTNKALLTKFPEINRLPKYYYGKAKFDFELKNLMLEVSIMEDKFNHIEYFENLVISEKKLIDYIVQIVTVDNSCLLYISGKQGELSSFYKQISDHNSLTLVKTIELKNNVC